MKRCGSNPGPFADHANTTTEPPCHLTNNFHHKPSLVTSVNSECYWSMFAIMCHSLTADFLKLWSYVFTNIEISRISPILQYVHLTQGTVLGGNPEPISWSDQTGDIQITIIKLSKQIYMRKNINKKLYWK